MRTNSSIIKRIALGGYIGIVAYATLLSRTPDHDPLSVVFSGWLISYGVDGWDFRPLYNALMLTPLMFLLLLNFPQIAGKSTAQLLKRAAWIGFLTSLFIECSQLIFCVGTFQISDLVYNTVSSVIGGYLYEMHKRYLDR